MISDEDFLRLFNTAMALAKPMGKPTVNAEQIDSGFESIDVDSLDLLIIAMYLCDAFAVPEEVGKEMRPANLREMKDFLVANATVEGFDVNSAIAVMQ
jgi:acyl carrier protein